MPWGARWRRVIPLHFSHPAGRPGPPLMPFHHKGSSSSLVVFAHVPPPEHGQSRMVAELLAGMAEVGQSPIHIDARFSDRLDGIGSVSAGKMVRLPCYLWQALRGRLFGGGRVLYYIPGPVKWSAVVRDWVVLGVLRPFFPRLVLHWHAVGQGVWAWGAREVRLPCPPWVEWWARRASRLVLSRPDLSVSVGSRSTADAVAVRSRQSVVVPNGLDDPCPRFREEVLPWRAGQGEILRRDPASPLRVLFLAHGTEQKGVLDAVRAVGELCRRWDQERKPSPVEFTMAGGIAASATARFEEEVARLEEQTNAGRLVIRRLGYVAGGEKARCWRDHHLLLFPSRWESFGLTVAEALAWGLPVVAAASVGVRGVLGEGHPHLCPVGDVGALAEAIAACDSDLRAGGMVAWARRHRARFLRCFRLRCHRRAICRVLCDVAGR